MTTRERARGSLHATVCRNAGRGRLRAPLLDTTVAFEQHFVFAGACHRLDGGEPHDAVATRTTNLRDRRVRLIHFDRRGFAGGGHVVSLHRPSRSGSTRCLSVTDARIIDDAQIFSVISYPSRQSRLRYVRCLTSGDILSLCNKSLRNKEIHATSRGYLIARCRSTPAIGRAAWRRSIRRRTSRPGRGRAA